MTSVIHRVLDWASNLRYEDVPPEAVEAAKRLLFDAIGCALAGSRVEPCRLVREYLLAEQTSHDCVLIGTPDRAAVTAAALHNALAIRALDFNDIFWKNDPCHPSDVIPAAMTLCEWKSLSGPELLVGVVLCYELLMRLCLVAEPGIRERGWHHATWTSIVAPIVAGRMLGLSAELLQNAVGVSAARGPALGCVAAGELSMMKAAADAFAVQAGVQAALLAQRGFTGPAGAIDGKEGLSHGLGAGWRWEALTEDLGRRFLIGNCSIKAYPVEALIQSPLSAMLRVVNEHAIQPEDVSELIVEVVPRAADILSDPAKYRPTNRETADHSLPYCLAVGIIDRNVSLSQFASPRWEDPRVAALMSGVRVVPQSSFEPLFPDKQPARVTILLRNNRSYSARVDVPKGDPRDPLTTEELRSKFDLLTEAIFRPDQRACIEDTIRTLEQLDDVNLLTAQLRQLPVERHEDRGERAPSRSSRRKASATSAARAVRTPRVTERPRKTRQAEGPAHRGTPKRTGTTPARKRKKATPKPTSPKKRGGRSSAGRGPKKKRPRSR